MTRPLRRSAHGLPDVGAPLVLLLRAEPMRALAEWVAGLVFRRALAHRAPVGDGHPAPVLPGLWASGRSTGLPCRFLRRLDYDALRWDLGRNKGTHRGLEQRMRTRLYEWLSGDRFEDVPHEQHARVRAKPPTPVTSVHSKTDGIVAWPCSIEQDRPEAESTHLRGGSHLGMAACPVARFLVAERLAKPEGRWQPLAPAGWRRLGYGVQGHPGQTVAPASA